jgi:hypothetical protein
MKNAVVHQYKLFILVAGVAILSANLFACRSSQRTVVAPPAESPKTATQPAKSSASDAKLVTDRRKGYFDHCAKSIVSNQTGRWKAARPVTRATRPSQPTPS